ncbi:nitrogen fixation protein NifM [uncultured Thiohalocapsa sp.]|uniref:nitrogen fixation protein NifM n=1 Tax=uncultured Thiohalocapsa sp. TaxID=768990 RepID=UPI0025D92247|nr:nitrogen fixation protein NifM [uncultured Thiohalocapsa sp.]
MSKADPAATEAEAAYRYHLLRAATERFQCNIPALDATQRAAAAAQADQTFALETLVLGADEAADIVIPSASLQQSLDAVAGRFDDPAEFEADLARNGLTPDGLRAALRRELTFDAVMQRVGARHAAVNDTDARLFYELHADRFQSPERRSARHILITVNADYAENTRDAARARADALAAKLHEGGTDNLVQRFARLARRHSECPTAMEEGKLGDLVRGRLYPEVDAALFELDAGTVSAPVESELGFHILLCECIEPARALPFPQVKDRIRAALEKRRRREAQRAWLAELREREAETA